MAETLANLKRERGIIKGKVTSFRTYLDSIDTSVDVMEPIDLRELETRFDIAQNTFDTFYSKHTEVISMLNEPTLISAEERKRIEFEDVYFYAIAMAQVMFDKFAPKPINTANSTPSTSSSQSTSVANATHYRLQQIQLPKISLPAFSGDLNAWLEFRDKYESLIHTNSAIAPIQKFHYLKSCLSAEAAVIIQGIEFTSDGYDQAWNALCSRYNNTRILIHNHLRALVSIEPIYKESASKLRNMLDQLQANLNALDKLKHTNASMFDALVVFLISSKFDSTTTRDWEKDQAPRDFSTVAELTTFIREKADLLASVETKRVTERISAPAKQSQANRQTFSSNRPIHAHLANTSIAPKCPLCKSEHFLRNCSEFLKLNTNDRFTKVKSLNRCINCFRYGHRVEQCAASACRQCGKRHNTLLHFNREGNLNNQAAALCANNTDNQIEPRFDQNTIDISDNTLNHYVVSTACHNFTSQILLSTAIVNVLDKHGKPVKARVLLDSGSQSNFITLSFAKKLNLELLPANLSISGISQNVSSINSRCNAQVRSIRSGYTIAADFLAIPSITGFIPAIRINPRMLTIPTNLTLADPTFYEPGAIDLLLGAEHFYALLCIGQISLGPRLPTLQKTQLGWVVSGMAGGATLNTRTVCNLAYIPLEEQMSRFWEIEDVPGDYQSEAEDPCELHFQRTTRRDPAGRFIVNIPTVNLGDLGDTRDLALQRFLKLKRKLQHEPKVRSLYDDFMKEYLLLGHMSPSASTSNPVYYLPHHCVQNPGSATTKLRVVFDGSATPSHGKSLNSCQLTGPTLQDELFALLLRFRTYNYVVTADIMKMYRQVLVDPDQRSLQRIFWRFSSDEPIQSYDLNTVTYGTAAASFLSSEPEIARHIRKDFYVDDLLTGADTIEEACRVIHRIDIALKGACFPLRKWTSNCPELLQGLAGITDSVDFLGSGGDVSKTLGLLWNHSSDTLSYRTQLKTNTHQFTKRIILSCISQIFDPLGLLAPCTVVAKILMQKLWKAGIAWDESIPLSLTSEWTCYCRLLPQISSISIPRHSLLKASILTEMHGFSDASESAYAACCYIRCSDAFNNVSCRLFCAKSKVAPLKVLSVPRLELCGALLLARLFRSITQSVELHFHSVNFWCDSTIVLSWLKACPSTLKTFVGNRIAKIQTITKGGKWRHVPTLDNPADLASRGVTPEKLIASELCWHGPEWLTTAPDRWPKAQPVEDAWLETRIQISLSHATQVVSPTIDNLKYSSLPQLERVVVYILRFLHNARCKDKKLRLSGFLTCKERIGARNVLVRIEQGIAFKEELRALRAKMPIKANSKVLSLAPFLDDEGLIRVGGRIERSEIHFAARHQLLLPKSSHFTKLLIKYEHVRNMHVGPLGLLNIMRQKYWLIGGRDATRNVVRACIACFKAKPRSCAPIMGQLPKERVTPSPPFYTCGVDYAGPYLLKTMHARGCKTFKAYIAVFVCFATKALIWSSLIA